MIQFKCSNCKIKQTIGSNQSLSIKQFNPKESIIIFSSPQQCDTTHILKKDTSSNYEINSILNCKKHIKSNTFFCKDCNYKIRLLIKQEINDLQNCMTQYIKCYNDLMSPSVLKCEQTNNKTQEEYSFLTDELKKIINNVNVKRKELKNLKNSYKNKLY